MKRSALILLVDAVSFAGFIFLTTTGILLEYILPPGSGRWSTVLGFSRHEWGEFHFIVADIFFTVLALHLFIHWRVIVNMVKGHAKVESWLRPALGLVGLIAITLLAAAPLIVPPETQTRPERQGLQLQQHRNFNSNQELNTR